MQDEHSHTGRSIVHHATPEERARHAEIRREIEGEIPELAAWARQVAGSGQGRVAVGAVFTAQEQQIIEAIDAYAEGHALSGRAAVVREALGLLLGMRIPQEPPAG
jgi:hypothetical protein